MLHKGRVHLFWTGGQSVALCQQPKPAHNSPKDDYANTSQPSYFPRNRRRAPRSYNCSAVMWKNKQVFFPFSFFSGSRVFSLRAQLQYVWDIQTHTYTHKHIMRRPGGTLSVYLLNERRLHTRVGWEYC